MKTVKELFDLIHDKGEGIYTKVHIIELDTYYDYEEQEFYRHVYRIYHSDGHCFEVKRFKTDNPDKSTINGYDYYFDSSMFDGFKYIKDAEHAICLIKNYLKTS